jgi:2,4-dienoyl-CoA reductase-like NADH-dependent reductase (Old Yellow Enzyme family)
MKTLFSPITLNSLSLANRIVIPPMCQDSAENGLPNEWHAMHYGHFAISGAGLCIVEATAVEAIGRITPYDLGLWNDEQKEAHKAMLARIRSYSSMPIAIQIGHAGRKASQSPYWEGKGILLPHEGGWEVAAPSALRYDERSSTPLALTGDDITTLKGLFVDAALRACEAGYDGVELHAAHGFLLHEFLSPLTNFRSDEYGGSLEGRMRFTLEVFEALRAALPETMPVGVRVSGTDFVEGGWDVEECAILARELEARKCSYIHVSSGGLSPDQKIEIAPGYQVALAARIKQELSMPVIAVGLITEPELADAIIVNGQADMVAIGRGMMYDPRWPWHAAAALGVTVEGSPRQYLRCAPRRFKNLLH